MWGAQKRNYGKRNNCDNDKDKKNKPYQNRSENSPAGPPAQIPLTDSIILRPEVFPGWSVGGVRPKQQHEGQGDRAHNQNRAADDREEEH